MASRRPSDYYLYNTSIPVPGHPSHPQSAFPVQAQIPQQVPYHGYSHPVVDVAEPVITRICESLRPSLQMMHDVNIKFGKEQQEAMTSLSNQLKEMRSEVEERNKHLTERLDSIQKLQVDTLKGLSVFTKQLENTIGMNTSTPGKGVSLTEKLDEVTFIVGELLERAKDPRANASEDMSTDNVSKNPEIIVLEDTPEPEPALFALNETTVPQTIHPALSPILPTCAQAGTSAIPEPSLHQDAATTSMLAVFKSQDIAPRAPAHHPERVSTSVEVGTSPLQLSRTQVDKGVSPIKATYVERSADAGSHSSEDVEMETASLDAPLNSSSCRQSSANTLVGDGSLPHTSPKLVKDAEIAADLDAPALEYIDDPSPLMISVEQDIVDNPGSHHLGHCNVNRSTSSNDKPNSFSLVDWSNEGLVKGQSITGGEFRSHLASTSGTVMEQDVVVPKKPMVVFHPDTSPQVTKSFSLLKDHDFPPDGTIASLRRDALGDSFAGPLTSTPPPTAPYYSCPSVSPMPSPESSQSPSPPPTSRRKRDKFSSRPSVIQQQEPEATGTSAESPPVDFTAGSAVHTAKVAAVPPASPIVEPNGCGTSQSPVSLIDEASVSKLVMQDDVSAHGSPKELTFEADLPVEEENHDIPVPVRDPLLLQTSPEVPEVPATAVGSRTFSPPPISFLSQSPPSGNSSEPSSRYISPAYFHISGSPQRVPSPSPAEPNTTATRALSPMAHSTLSPLPLSPACPKENVRRTPSPIRISSASPSPSISFTAHHRFTDDDDDAPIIPVSKVKVLDNGKETEGSKPPPKVNLAALALRSRANKAATRVKKRKEKPKVEDEEPPSKRARQRRSVDRGKEKVTDAGNAKGKDKDKAPTKVPSQLPTKRKSKQKSSVPSVKWPATRKNSDETFSKKYIKCDMCLAWYHYGCVGINKPNDLKLKQSFTFVCPPCDVGSTSTHPVRTDEGSCARPACTLDDAGENEYYVSGIIGRKTKVEGGYGRKYIWLLKWEGYPVSASTWEGEESMADPQKLIEDFEDAATKEGWDVEGDPYCTILLREAIAAGWQSDEGED